MTDLLEIPFNFLTSKFLFTEIETQKFAHYSDVLGQFDPRTCHGLLCLKNQENALVDPKNVYRKKMIKYQV